MGEDYHEYELVIPNMMLNDKIKQLESYQMFIKYSTGQIPPKKSRGKVSQGKKTVDVSQENVDISKGYKPEPVKKKTASRRVKKKVTILEADNIIFDPDVALELGKSISLNEAAEEEAARQVHATHARIMTESILKPAKRRPSNSSQKLKGVQALTPEEQEVADTMKAIKESRKTSRRHPSTRGLSKGTGAIPEEDQINDEEKNDKYGDADDECDDNISDIQDTDDKDVEPESDEDEIYKYKIRLHKDEDEEMTNDEVEDSRQGDAEISNVAKADVKKTKEVKDDAKKAELPPTSSSLSVSLGFGDQFLKLSSDTSLVSTVKDTTDVEINSCLRVAKLENDVSGLKKVDHSAEALSTLKSQVPTVVESYLGSKFGDVLQMELQKHTADFIQKHCVKPTPESSKIQTPTNLEQGSEKSALEILKIKRKQAKKQKMPKYTIKSTNKAALKEYDQKSALYQTMHENKSFNRNHANNKLYHALMEALKEDENAMDKEVTDTVKDHKRKHHDDDDDDDDEDPPARQTRVRRQRGEEPKSQSLPRNNPSPRKPLMVKLHQKAIKLSLFNQMVSATKDPLTFNDLMATPIDFSKYGLNQLKIDNLTQDLLLGPAYNLLKGTCASSIELEYNFQECCNALIDKLDWSNREGDHYPFDLSKPLPLQSHPGHLIVAANYFFNNDLEYLKSSDLERTYTTSITKTKATCDVVDFIVALRMFTRSLVIKKQIESKELYTPSYNPPRVIYEDLNKQKRVMRADELYKFSDETLKNVQDEIHHRAINFCLGYNDEMSRKK
uniref:Uncharacterized protein n=1 Tax=Tanacetum cinerariifolium TaxID=118510 RepID=A0A6L2JI03_TANCI|nr:hypothetical protein [Tanacetum cinerariifolium]